MLLTLGRGLSSRTQTIPSNPSNSGTGSVAAFDFTDVIDASVSTLTSSNAVQVSGFTDTRSVSVSDGSDPQFRTMSIDGVTVIHNWGNASRTINANQYVQVRDTSSSNNSTTINPIVTVGERSADFAITTIVAPNIVDPFDFV